jgi:hypothetical protein
MLYHLSVLSGGYVRVVRSVLPEVTGMEVRGRMWEGWFTVWTVGREEGEGMASRARRWEETAVRVTVEEEAEEPARGRTWGGWGVREREVWR